MRTPFQGKPLRGQVTFDDVASGSHVVMHNGALCTTTIVRQSAGIGCACAEYTSGHVTSGYVISGRAAAGDVTSGSST